MTARSNESIFWLNVFPEYALVNLNEAFEAVRNTWIVKMSLVNFFRRFRF